MTSTQTMSAPKADLRTAPARPGRGVTMGGLLRSEWTKLRSVRSTGWTLLVAVAMMVGMSGLIAAAVIGQGEQAGVDLGSAGDLSLAGTSFAQLAVAVLGVLVISGEYRTGMIRTTFTAVPRRGAVLAAKALVFSVVTFLTGLVAAFGAFYVGQGILGVKDMDVPLSHPGMLRAIIGVALYLTVTGLLGLALGTLLRHTAGAITTVVVLLFLLPPLIFRLPGEWGAKIAEYFLSSPGSRITMVDPPAEGLGPWAGLGVYCLWVAVALAGAVLLLRRRDV